MTSSKGFLQFRLIETIATCRIISRILTANRLIPLFFVQDQIDVNKDVDLVFF